MRYDLYIKFNQKENIKELVYFEGDCFYTTYSKDKIKITNKQVKIELSRKRKRDMKKMIVGYDSTINMQINKILCYIACTLGRIPEITAVTLVDINGKRIDFNFSEINQPLNGQIDDHLRIEDVNLLVLFNSNEKSNDFLIAISLWLKGITEELEGQKFSKLWKSFNTMYSYITKEENEFNKLVEMKKFIFNHKYIFKSTVSYLDEFDSNIIRKIRWREMILNDYEKESQTKSFELFIRRYKDYRLNQVFKEILPYRKKYLKKRGTYDEIIKVIDENINNKVKDNFEVLTFYVLKYSYFIRNKYFHGEKFDSTFHLIKNDEIKELSIINHINIK